MTTQSSKNSRPHKILEPLTILQFPILLTDTISDLRINQLLCRAIMHLSTSLKLRITSTLSNKMFQSCALYYKLSDGELLELEAPMPEEKSSSATPNMIFWTLKETKLQFWRELPSIPQERSASSLLGSLTLLLLITQGEATS